jgi:hypothetical protein
VGQFGIAKLAPLQNRARKRRMLESTQVKNDRQCEGPRKSSTKFSQHPLNDREWCATCLVRSLTPASGATALGSEKQLISLLQTDPPTVNSVMSYRLCLIFQLFSA